MRTNRTRALTMHWTRDEQGRLTVEWEQVPVIKAQSLGRADRRTIAALHCVRIG